MRDIMLDLPEPVASVLRQTHISMYRAGCAAPDLRWLEQQPYVCPVCGKPGTPAIISTLLYPVPEGFTYVPYLICQDCTDRYWGDERIGAEALDSESLQAAIFTQLGIEPDMEHSFLGQIAPEHHRTILAMVHDAIENESCLDLSWLVRRPHTCAACGRTLHAQSCIRCATLVLAQHDDLPVDILFLLCPGCSLRDTTQIQQMASPHLVEVFLQEAERRTWIVPLAGDLVEAAETGEERADKEDTDAGAEADHESADPARPNVPAPPLRRAQPPLRLLERPLSPPDDSTPS